MATPIPVNRAAFTLEEVARVTGGVLSGGSPSDVLRGVVIDSRRVERGCLFVALRGERHDAHRFVPDAAAGGAAALLVAHDAPLPPGLETASVAVDDTERALGELAAAHRASWGGVVVGITGSAGKTSTKDLVAAALAATGTSVLKTAGNLNNTIGVPMTLFALDPSHQMAVVELGTSRPGEIARLAEIAHPDVGLVTLVAAAHTEGLGDVTAVAREKAALWLALGPEGVAVVNADDRALATWVERAGAEHRVSFGVDSAADVRLSSHRIEPDLRTRCRYVVRGAEIEVTLGLLGEAAALNAAAALAVVVGLRRDLDLAARGIEAVEPTPGRLQPRELGELVVLDDTYNANPRSTALALDTASAVGRVRRGRVLAVLGDMKELGALAETAHAEIGRRAAQAGLAALVCCGPDMVATASAARATLPELEVRHVADAAAAARELRSMVAPGDVVLVKGSRSMEMEQVVRALVEGSRA